MHWLSTGEVLGLVDLTGTSSLTQLEKKLTKAKPNRGDWIVGFGWDETNWPTPERPNKNFLDRMFPNNPVALSRIDGHTLWVNSKTLEISQLNKRNLPPLQGAGRIELDEEGELTGVFVDYAKEFVDCHIPNSSEAELLSYLQKANDVFIKAGFTHIRDVGGSFRDWELAKKLENNRSLTLFSEIYFNLEDISKIAERLNEVIEAQQHKSKQIRVAGLKLFFDGALGSEGAFLSKAYANGSYGIRLYELSVIEEIFQRAWDKNIPVAIHTLGDEAVHQIVGVAVKLKERGVEGPLHLEHCEVVRPETIRQMRSLNLRCHLQPSHFLSDRIWLKEKLGDLYKFCFPWRNLIENGIQLSFGSDSPIEAPSLIKTQKALEAAAQEGIALPPISPWSFHSHPDGSWGGSCVTRFSAEGKVDCKFRI